MSLWMCERRDSHSASTEKLTLSVPSRPAPSRPAPFSSRHLSARPGRADIKRLFSYSSLARFPSFNHPFRIISFHLHLRLAARQHSIDGCRTNFHLEDARTIRSTTTASSAHDSTPRRRLLCPAHSPMAGARPTTMDRHPSSDNSTWQ